jgi:DNA-binding transcriptional LysR family regulator
VTFVAVYETMNYNRASEILGISRQAVSQNLRELGNQLGGLKLFIHDPVNRCVTPTSEATAMYPDIKEAVEKMIEVEEGLQAFTSESKAVIRMGIPSSIASVLFADFFKEFRQKYPHVRFEFYSKDSIELLQQKKLDFIVHMKPVFSLNNFKVVELYEEEYAFIGSGIDKNISKEQLLKLPIIGHKESLNEFKNLNGLDFIPFLETPTAETIYGFTKNGMGIGYFFGKLFEKMNDDAKLVKVNVNGVILPKVSLVCCYNKSHLTKAAKTFIEGLKNFCSTLS